MPRLASLPPQSASRDSCDGQTRTPLASIEWRGYPLDSMRLNPSRVVVVMALGALALGDLAPSADADIPTTYPLSKVRRGQTGYGMTTIQGTKPERFSFEVVGVTKNFLPKQDIILVKSDDPKLQVSGFW